MIRRILVIANPISGGGRARRLAPEFADHLRRNGVETEICFTQRAGEASERARTAGGEPWAGLIAVGGDGTINEVLNGMPDPSRPLGVLPVGTANVLALELGLPRRPQRAADIVLAGRTRRLGIGLAGDRRFLLFCGIGIDGAVVESLERVRSGTLGKRKWAAPILHVVRHWPQYRLRAEFADGERLDDLSSVLVTRVRNYGGVVQLVRGIDVADGQLHVLCFRMRSRLAWAWQGLRGILRTMRPGPDLVVKRTTAVHVDGAAPFQIDGDHGGSSPVAVRLCPGHANVFAP